MRISSTRRSRKSGSVMVLFTLMLPSLMLPLAGLAIDASVARLIQIRLQAAVDGAVLGAGRLLGTEAVPETLAREFLAANFRTDGVAGTWGAFNLQSNVVYTPGITKRIDVNASAQVPLLFLRILGFNNATVGAAGSATRTDSRVVVVIDRSGSMSDGSAHTVLDDAKSYSAGFVQKFTESADELGLVVFGASAVVAYPTLNPNWDSTTTAASTGGPDAVFNDPANPDNMVQQIGRIQTVSNGVSTNTSEALWLAYIELQKTHMKDLAADGHDYRLNSIVLLTDGLPQALTVRPNNPNDNSIKTTAASGCVNKYNATTNPTPIPIYGFVSISRDFSTQTPMGLYQIASRDLTAAHNSVWWMTNPTGDLVSLLDPPGLPTYADVGCAGFRASAHTSLPTDFSKLPALDAYGNDMTCPAGVCAYRTASQFVNASGASVTNPLDLTKSYNNTQVNDGDQWALAAWNATDSAAKRIRADVNLVNRAGDVQNMKIAIHVIGYSGNAPGLDQGLLRRVANDKSSIYYDSTQAAGVYVRAGDAVSLANAFNTVFTAMMRLAR